MVGQTRSGCEFQTIYLSKLGRPWNIVSRVNIHGLQFYKMLCVDFQADEKYENTQYAEEIKF